MSRFIRRGVSKILFSPTIANINAVTRSELDSAEDLSAEVAEISGWAMSNQAVSTPDFASDFDSSIPGIDSVGDSSLTFYEDSDTEVIEELLPKGTEGYVLILRKGDKPGSNSLDCFPVRVPVKSNEYSAGNDAARFQVTFNITARPGLDGPVPAAATP